MIFFLFGEDIYSSKKKLLQLKTAFIEKNPMAEVGIFDFSEKNVSLEQLIESFSSGGLFSSKKMLVVENAMSSLLTEKQKNLLEEIKKRVDLEKDPEMLLIFREDGLPKKTLSLWKFLFSKAKNQQFNILDQKNLEKWVSGWTTKNFPKISFSKKSIEMLISYTGKDLFLLENELEKIGNFKNEGEITEDDIDLLVKSHVQSNIFQTIEALLGRNKKLALKLFHEQLEKGEDPFYILSMYIYQIRTFLKISSALDNGNISPFDISKETGLHPYVIQKSISQARLTGTKNLKNIFQNFQKIDSQLKIGKTELKLAIDKLIASI